MLTVFGLLMPWIVFLGGCTAGLVAINVQKRRRQSIKAHGKADHEEA